MHFFINVSGYVVIISCMILKTLKDTLYACITCSIWAPDFPQSVLSDNRVANYSEIHLPVKRCEISRLGNGFVPFKKRNLENNSETVHTKNEQNIWFNIIKHCIIFIWVMVNSRACLGYYKHTQS